MLETLLWETKATLDTSRDIIRFKTWCLTDSRMCTFSERSSVSSCSTLSASRRQSTVVSDESAPWCTSASRSFRVIRRAPDTEVVVEDDVIGTTPPLPLPWLCGWGEATAVDAAVTWSLFVGTAMDDDCFLIGDGRRRLLLLLLLLLLLRLLPGFFALPASAAVVPTV